MERGAGARIRKHTYQKMQLIACADHDVVSRFSSSCLLLRDCLVNVFQNWFHRMTIFPFDFYDSLECLKKHGR